MKQMYKEVLLIFIYNIANSIYSLWPLVYPYLCSYINHFKSDMTMNQGFFTTLFLFLGIPVGSAILPKMYFLFGIKNTMILGGILFFFNCVLYLAFTSLFLISLNALFSGILYQLGVTSTSYYLSEKYNDGFLYCSYAYIGQNVCNFIWPFICVWLINPNNLDMEFNEQNQESYFPWEISKKFPLMMFVIGLVSSLFAIIPSFFLHDPSHIKPNFRIWIKAFINRDTDTLNNLSVNYIEQSERHSKHSSMNRFSVHDSMYTPSINFSKKSQEEPLMEGFDQNLTDEEAEKKANKIIMSPQIIFFVIFLSIRTGPLMYLVDNYKLISINLLKNDELISLALSLSSLISIFGQVIIIKVWNVLGFYKTQVFLSILSLLVWGMYIQIAVTDRFFMFWIISLNRIVSKMVYGSIYFTKFGLFHPKVAIYISKMIDMSYFLSMIYAVGLNSLFFSQSDIVTIFVIFFGSNVILLLIFILFYKDFAQFVKNI